MAKKSPSKTATPALSESNWRASSDAHTLREAAMIKSDPKRHGPAKTHAKKEAQAFLKVSGEGEKRK